MLRSSARSLGLGLFVVTALAMRLASTPTADLSYLLLASYALLGRAQAIQALALSWLFTFLSPGLAVEANYDTIGRYAVLVGAGASAFVRSGALHGGRVTRVVSATLMLGAFICAHAILVSPMKDVSLLKAVSWALACATLMSAWSGLSNTERNRIEGQLFGGLIILTLISLPLLFTALGYLRNGTGFQGVLNHPQAFGLTMAVLAAWAGARVLTAEKSSFRLMGLFLVCSALIVLSEARTAGFALVFALVLAMSVLQVLTRQQFFSLFPGIKNRGFHLSLLVGLAVVLLFAPLLSGVLQGYIAKRGGTTDLVDVYDVSRGGLMEQMQTNIRVHPWTGIGFGIASDPYDMEVTRDPVLGLPVGAPIEKGVLPLAVLEELGIPGAIAVLAWLWLMLRRSISSKSLVPIALLFTALLLNMGEMILFSPGGMGLLLLIVVSFAASETPARPTQAGPLHG